MGQVIVNGVRRLSPQYSDSDKRQKDFYVNDWVNIHMWKTCGEIAGHITLSNE